MLPLVIHNGRSRWRAPLRLETLFVPVPKDLKRYLLMSERFGRLPKEVRSRVEQISSPQELERLTRKILSAKSLEDMELSHRNR